MILNDSFKNPFAEFNANVLLPSQIINLWCSPFQYIKSASIGEHEIFRDKNPIVFMGGRGTGKTMFLRYWSYQVQCSIANDLIKNKEIRSKLDHISNLGGIGFYVRFDGPILKSFSEMGLSIQKWDAIFTHYFELYIAKLYVDAVIELDVCNGLDSNSTKSLLSAFSNLVNINTSFLDLNDVSKYFAQELKKVTDFRGQRHFEEISFIPKKGFSSQSLSYEIPLIFRSLIPQLSEIGFIVFIDEYENFLDYQQKMVNALLKFVKPGITFRIGMRLEGFKTYDTVSKDEFIKEGRDYRKIVFEEILMRDSSFQQFFIEIAKKRLESTEHFNKNSLINIKDFLGNKEDLENEAREVILNKENKTKHFDLLDNKSKTTLELIKNENNPLLEMLNILWVNRGIPPHIVKKTMTEYLSNIDNNDTKKYKLDYISKYKLSLMFLFCSVYRTDKKYYSFNTLCYLSSGIVGHFLEICRLCFQYAHFEDRDGLLFSGKISPSIQHKAVKDYSNLEVQLITRIEEYGDLLFRFTKNLGNVFRLYHTDKYLRYPETMQFSKDLGTYDDENIKKAFRAAIKWSVIQRKPNLQNPVPGEHKSEIYLLNRIFSPSFQITYRIRGGNSEEYSFEDIKTMMFESDIMPKRKLEAKYNQNEQQHEMFPLED